MTTVTATRPGTGQRKSPARTRALVTRVGFLGPFYTAFALFFVLPIGFAIYESLLSQRRIGGIFGTPIEVFTGLRQYEAVFSDPQFWSGIRTVVLYICVLAPLMATVGVTLALLLDVTAPRLARVFRTSYFVPYAVSQVVATILWGALYTPGSSPLSEFHIHVDLLSHSLVFPSIVNIVIWEWAGFNVILMTTALTAIPAEIFDSARVDGASKLGMAWHIKLPLIRPTIVMSMVLTFNRDDAAVHRTTSHGSDLRLHPQLLHAEHVRLYPDLGGQLFLRGGDIGHARPRGARPVLHIYPYYTTEDLLMAVTATPRSTRRQEHPSTRSGGPVRAGPPGAILARHRPCRRYFPDNGAYGMGDLLPWARVLVGHCRHQAH